MIQKFKHWFLSIFSHKYLLDQANERLDWQDFYEVMQSYRHSPMTEQHKVVNAFEDVKEWIKENYK